MSDGEKISFPFGILVLEFVGSVLMILGFVKKFAGVDFLPALSQFDASGWLLIGLGFLLTLPFVLFILAKVREKAAENTAK